MKILQTPRLLLRPWREEDAEDMFEYARDPRVGPNAGWTPHKSLADTRITIRGFLHDKNCDTRAVVLKSENRPIGSIGLHRRSPRRLRRGREEREIGYVLNPAYWGHGYIPEAVNAVLYHALFELGVDVVWCGHYDFNDNSRRVIEKCGFSYVFRREEMLYHMDDRFCYACYYAMDRRHYRAMHPEQFPDAPL